MIKQDHIFTRCPSTARLWALDFKISGNSTMQDKLKAGFKLFARNWAQSFGPLCNWIDFTRLAGPYGQLLGKKEFCCLIRRPHKEKKDVRKRKVNPQGLQLFESHSNFTHRDQTAVVNLTR